MLDRDFDAVINGLAPENDDLAPLSHFVTDLKALTSDPQPDVVDLHSSMSASTARAHREVAATRTSDRPKRNPVRALRRRAVALAASLAMLSGMTGLAWAADHAGPGDWLYGLDRALERIGIGAGGAAERLEELANGSHQDGANHGSSTVEAPGLEHAIEVVSNNGGDKALDVHTEVVVLLEHLANGGIGDGAAISTYAKSIGADHRPTEPGQPAHTGKP